MAPIDELLRYVKDQDGSDLHLTSGSPPRLRRHGALQAVATWPILGDEAVRDLVRPVCSDRVWRDFGRNADVDFSHEVKGVARFRGNLFDQEYGMGAVFRIVPEKIVPLVDLRLPSAIERLVSLPCGLVLVTGPTGSGKTTTLAAIIDAINRTYVRHVVTIEDPIEFVHSNRKSVISHREVGVHTHSFANALRAAIRQDADVVMVGEMRDWKTVALTLTAASMGILVFGTMHTNSAAKTVDRLIDLFPADQQRQARSELAETLSSVVSQLLVPTAGRDGRVAAVEILMRRSGLANIIREGKMSMIQSAIQSGRGHGSQTMDDALFDLVERGVIHPTEGHRRALEKNRFEPLVARR